jgi:site-specific recombinase
LNYNDKWDIYSISVLYTHIIGNLIQVFSLKDTFLTKLVIDLSKNLHPDPLKRSDLDNMLEIYNKLFDNQKTWQFVNDLSSSKMIQLYDILEK